MVRGPSMSFLLTSTAAAALGLATTALAARVRGERFVAGLVAGAMALLAGLIGAHLVAVLVYAPQSLEERPLLTLFSLTYGLSSAGGFLGGALGVCAFARLARRSFAWVADIVLLGVAAAWPLARYGCYLAHDHPGSRSEFLLASAYPDGARHDLGLYEALLAVPILALCGRAFLRRGNDGAVLATFVCVYAPARFLLDFLRIHGADAVAAVACGAVAAADVDRRHGGLTFAQWACLAALLALGGARWAQRQRAPAAL
jgi:phosphatidylglycerol:prolipoprotein diacylglycerol transferase